MTDLFKKLNVLVKSGLNDLLTDATKNLPIGNSSRTPTQHQLGKNIDREMSGLRQRINDALDYEEQIKRQINTHQVEIARLDVAADNALNEGREEAARHLVEQMQRAEQRLTMAKADLREHQAVTQELILRVNEMETWVEEAKRVQREEAEAKKAEAENALDESVDENNTLSGILRRAQDTISDMGNLISKARQDHDTAESAAEIHERVDTKPSEPNPKVEDDLEKRRQRLSKR